MIVFCEECGERYVVEEEDIQGTSMMFICRVCNDIIRIPEQAIRCKPEEKAQDQTEKG